MMKRQALYTATALLLFLSAQTSVLAQALRIEKGELRLEATEDLILAATKKKTEPAELPPGVTRTGKYDKGKAAWPIHKTTTGIGWHKWSSTIK